MIDQKYLKEISENIDSILDNNTTTWIEWSSEEERYQITTTKIINGKTAIFPLSFSKKDVEKNIKEVIRIYIYLCNKSFSYLKEEDDLGVIVE